MQARQEYGTVRIVGVVDRLGYLYCVECRDILSPEYHDGTRYVWSDTAPHNVESCDGCKRPVAAVRWPQ